MQSLLDWRKSVQIAMQSDIHGVAKWQACGDWGVWEKENMFIEHLQYAIITLLSSDVTKPDFLLIV